MEETREAIRIATSLVWAAREQDHDRMLEILRDSPRSAEEVAATLAGMAAAMLSRLEAVFKFDGEEILRDVGSV